MVYLLFFYDMVVTMASLALCVVFAILFARGRNRLHLWLSLLFGFCTLDIVLMYLLDFVPEFQVAFHGTGAPEPLLYAYVHFVILFCCRAVVGTCFGEPPRMTEAPLWILLIVAVTVASLLSPAHAFTLVKNLCIGVVQVYIVVAAIRGMRGDEPGEHVMSDGWLWALIVTFAVCAAGYLVYACVADMTGLLSPRNPFVDLSGGAYLVFACAYLVFYWRRGHEATLDDVIAETSERYDLTRREAEILLMVAEGRSNQEISSALYISLGTVKTHVHNIYVKLGISKRSELRPLLERQSAGTPHAVYFEKK